MGLIHAMKIFLSRHHNTAPVSSCLSMHADSIPTASHVLKKNECSRARPIHQRGATAIEFALVFPIFFLIFYGIITYGLIMVAQQSITLAAAEGARAALRETATEETRNDNAEKAATGNGSAASWLADRLTFEGTLLENCPYTNDASCYQVTVSYPDYRNNPLVPLILGPLMGIMVPAQLSSTATVQLD